MKVSTQALVALSLSLATVGVTLPFAGVRAEDPAPMTTEVNQTETTVLDQVDAYVEAWQLEDAIALLEGVAAEGSQVPGVYQKLGDLYRQAGQDPAKSARSYETAIELANQSQDLSAKASAQIALANLLIEYNKIATASEWLSAAQANYQAAGQEEAAAAVAQQIATLDETEVSEPSNLTLRGASNSDPLGDVGSPGFIDFPAREDNPIQDSSEPGFIDFPAREDNPIQDNSEPGFIDFP